MDTDIARPFIELRALVGFLGEKTQAGWWDTGFLNATGQRFLAVTFPRTALAAGVASVTEAARRLHDERIGKGGVFHLFRLPLPAEESLHQALQQGGFESLQASLQDRDAALAALRRYARDGLRAPAGPVQVGTGKNMLTAFAIEELAKHYHDAFTRGIQTFPYFLAS